MPIYDFKCPKCEHAFEVTRPMSKAGAGAKCPKCKTKATRLFTAAIVTTGTGSSGFDLDEDSMPNFGSMGGGMDGGMPDMGSMGGMPDMGGMGGDFDF